MRLAVLALLAACAAPDPRILGTTVPADTRDTVGPYTIRVVVRDVGGDDRVELRFSLDDVDFVGLETDETEGRSDLRYGEIPGQPRGSRVFFYAVVLRDGDEAARGEEASFAIAGLDACLVDTDCASGEICGGEPDGRCIPFGGACLGDGSCPDGYVCDDDDACVIPVLACGGDDGCPSAEVCDLERQECRPRQACSETMPCPDGQTCRPDYGLCWDS